ncbi:MBL fold metallo-hydrolase [Geodermatophilus sp. SYSU D00758]
MNRYLLEDGADPTLADAGHPGDADDVERSVALTGHRTEDVRAVVVAHAHTDHPGGCPGCRRPTALPSPPTRSMQPTSGGSAWSR